MSTASCQSPLEWHALLAYRLGELDPDSEARIEEHYLGCAGCSQRLEQLIALAREVRALARTSGVNSVINHHFVRRLSERGLQVREYRVPRNGSVNCTVAPDDDFVVARLEAPLGGVTRLDLIDLDHDGLTAMRHEDIPFVADDGGVVISPSIEFLRSLPATTLRMRLLAVDASGERTLGEYTFNHSPYPPPGAQ
ncbi:MAG: zf-HC2 domain-containing protein [Rhodanobacter sp.]|jgi:hypothetical protein|nr:zf-HC2 domain-containing protein [Rhodanobacter sp.]